MIWLDSSFAIEWLLGTNRAAKSPFKTHQACHQVASLLPAQYAEILVYFGKKIPDISPVVEQLESLDLGLAGREELQLAAALYLRGRKLTAKVSLADSILAAVAHKRKEDLLSFDSDFKYLGLTEKEGLWTVVS